MCGNTPRRPTPSGTAGSTSGEVQSASPDAHWRPRGWGRHLTPVLRLSKLEGDAAFAYALETEIEPSMLLDTIEQTYFGFRSRVRDIRQATTCECNACVLIPNLNLKFTVHHGQFVRREMAGREELTGTDVIVVHRLLKNSVADRLDLRGYALFTQSCIDALGIEPAALDLTEHTETYEDVGEVPGWVEDLETRWRYEDERRRVFVVPSEAELEVVHEYPTPPPVTWEYLTSPHKRMLWQDVKRIDEENPGGRRGPGATAHCVHGSNAILQEILDWRPFRYFTLRQQISRFGEWVWTLELRPTDDGGTELRIRPERLTRLMQRLMWKLMRRKFMADEEEQHQRLLALVEGEEAVASNTQAAGT
jgi:hypothetical protein